MRPILILLSNPLPIVGDHSEEVVQVGYKTHPS